MSTYGFVHFRQDLQRRIKFMSGYSLFVVECDKDELWQHYLNSFPEGTNPIYRERTEHDCNCCKQFVKKIGLMVIVYHGELMTIWDVKTEDPAYQEVADSMSAFVKSKTIASKFYTHERMIGTEKTFESMVSGVHTWEHYCANTPPAALVPDNLTANKKISDERGAYQVIRRSFEEVTSEACEIVLDLCNQNSLYRGAEFFPAVKHFLVMKEAFEKSKNKEHFVWMSLENRALGIRNTAIGTLLIDLSEGMDVDKAVRKYEAVVAPANYKRPKAIVTPKMIQEAKTALEEGGYLSALERKIASIDEISIENLLFADRFIKPSALKDVFDEIEENLVVDTKKFSKSEKVTIKDFLTNIVPNSTMLELLVESRHRPNFMYVTGPQDFTAKNMFKWGNPFAWGYSGDVTDSIKEKVKAAGGNVTGDVCCRLAWFNADDLDLHMKEPNHQHIYFGNKVSALTGGRLDVDMNAGGIRNAVDPVENIYYGRMDRMMKGVYCLFVHQFTKRDNVRPGFEVEIDIKGDTYHFTYPDMVRGDETIKIAELTFDGSHIKVNPVLGCSRGVSKEMNGIQTQSFTKVKAIMLSPNHWDQQKIGNRHFFFVLDGCKVEDSTRGFYNEFLREDLGVNKRFFELLGSKLKVEDVVDPVCGLGFSETQKNSFFVRVHGSFTRIIEVVLQLEGL